MDKVFNIEEIKSPEFIKQLSIKELQSLCEQIRTFIIDNVSKTGGHLSSNLGDVEAIVALHYVFDSPKDKFLFDVSHQAYTHKILTGRAKDFKTLRQKNGLSGFLNYQESVHDVLETGHSSTTISAAAGFLEAKEVNKEIGEVIAFIGDGAISNGVAFEGLDYIGSTKKQKLILVLNDNQMSISKNVGRLAKSFSKMRIKRGYHLLKKATPRFIRTAFSRAVNSMKTFIYGKNIFSALGYKYYGPIDGNNIEELIKYFKFAKEQSFPIVLHINTTKGKGYKPAENDISGKWHGVSPFLVENGDSLSSKKENYISWSKGISNIIDNVLENNSNARIISPATLVGSELACLDEKHKGKIIDVGINEEHAVIMAATMARNGIIPFVSIYSTFMQRSYDFINLDVARCKNHVIFLIDRAGLVAGDGATHQGIFDISMLSALPNFEIAMPSNLKEANSIINYAITSDKPIAIRYPKCDTLDYKNETDIRYTKPFFKVIKEIKDVNVITYGEFIGELEPKLTNYNVGLINAIFIKPLDEDVLLQLKNKTLIVIEEVIKVGSLASLLFDANSKYNLNIKIVSLGIDDKYPDIGTRKELLQEFKLDSDSLIEIIKSYLL